MGRGRKKVFETEDGFLYCSYCQEVKPEEEFYQDESRSSGRRGYCTHCDNELRVGRKRRQREKEKEYGVE
jgi:hypothetical protein